MVYLITYDLNKPGQDYDKIHKAIKSLGDYIHPLESTWLVDTVLTSAQAICQKLEPQIDKTDSILVIKATKDYYGWLRKEHWEWMDKHIK